MNLVFRCFHGLTYISTYLIAHFAGGCRATKVTCQNFSGLGSLCDSVHNEFSGSLLSKKIKH